MAKLARKGQKIFARTATNNGVFGSLQAGNKQTSQDVETLQSLDAYSEGWNSATISSEQLPPLEEFQSLNYVNTYQLAYMFQEGIPEWDSNSYYHQGSIVKVTTDNTFVLYNSLTDNNTGNNPATDRTNWAVYLTSDALSQGLPGWRNDVNYVKGAWVKGGDTETVIYESLVDNNLNHALTDTSYWQIKSFGSIDNRVTNCVLSGPTNIKYTLSFGTLTIKAGSKLYVPSGFSGGQRSFTEFTVPSDVSIDTTTSDSARRFIFYDTVNNSIVLNLGCRAGGSQPSSSEDIIWYDLGSNVINWYQNGSSTGHNFAFPLGEVRGGMGRMAGSIVQMFQFSGYMGFCFFMYPGAVVAFPNGRKDDGTLNNTIYTVNSVLISGASSGADLPAYFILLPDGTLSLVSKNVVTDGPEPPSTDTLNGYWLNSITNKCYSVFTSTLTEQQFAIVGEALTSNSGMSIDAISDGSIKEPIRLIDYFDYPKPVTGFMSYPTSSTFVYMYTGTQALPSGGTWAYWVHGNNHTGATDTSVLTGGIAAGGTVLGTNPGTGFEKSYVAWRIQ